LEDLSGTAILKLKNSSEGATGAPLSDDLDSFEQQTQRKRSGKEIK
jgi:hypothetical protein